MLNMRDDRGYERTYIFEGGGVMVCRRASSFSCPSEYVLNGPCRVDKGGEGNLASVDF